MIMPALRTPLVSANALMIANRQAFRLSVSITVSGTGYQRRLRRAPRPVDNTRPTFRRTSFRGSSHHRLWSDCHLPRGRADRSGHEPRLTWRAFGKFVARAASAGNRGLIDLADNIIRQFELDGPDRLAPNVFVSMIWPSGQVAAVDFGELCRVRQAQDVGEVFEVLMMPAKRSPRIARSSKPRPGLECPSRHPAAGCARRAAIRVGRFCRAR